MHVDTERIYTLADLENWPTDRISLAVIGYPVSHSLSPAMHNAALAELAKKEDQFKSWYYFKFEIPSEDLKLALDLFYEKGFRGLNLTVPHKVLVMQYLNLGPEHQLLRELGAANTLSITKDRDPQRAPSFWQGINTDSIGLSAALYDHWGLELKDANIILLGAGGAARAAAVKCLSEGCASLWIGNRTEVTRKELLNTLKRSVAIFLRHRHPNMQDFDPQNPPSSMPTATIVINATSLGLKRSDGSPLDLTKIQNPSFVYDMIYRPSETALLRQAAQLKIPCENGRYMLVHQGARSLEEWTGKPAPVEIMRKAVDDALSIH